MIAVPANADLSSGKGGDPPAGRHHHFHHHAHEQDLTRRQFLKSGLALFGAAAGASLLRGSGLAAKPGTGIPKQIPDFSVPLLQAFGIEIPFLLPAEVDPFAIPPDSVKTPTTIWDFNGFVGLVEADGVSDPAQNTDGVARRWACDVRFMQGVFVDRQGRTQPGSFAFFWLDVFEDPSLGPFDPAQVQLHDVNPGDLNVPGEPNHFPEGGVFWTRPVPEHSITVHPGKGDASFVLSDFALLDFFDVVNAILRIGPAPIPATASVDLKWQGTGERVKVSNESADFAGQYENAGAAVQWSFENAEGYAFSTANSSETNVTHALVAHVRTGSFHKG